MEPFEIKMRLGLLQNLLYSTYDSHLVLDLGVLAAFALRSPYPILTFSIDGIQLPKVWIRGTTASSAKFD